MSRTDTKALAPTIAALAEQVRGPVLRPGDTGYDEERAGFQAGARHRPTVIVGATGPPDVEAAVRAAATAHLPVGVLATGHGQPVGAAEGGVLIATRRMGGVRVDPDRRTAWFEAGVRWADVVRAAAPHGLAPLSGSFPEVGAVAYTLGGGVGLLARRYGFAADHVRSIDVVTADGRRRHVTPAADPDLFWALRGGRDNFGVVTALEVDLMPVARLYGGGLYFGPEQAADALEAYRRWTATVPDEMTSAVAMVPYPDIPAIPEPLRGRHVTHLRIAYAGEPAAGERLVAPLRAVGPRLVDTLADMPYAEGGSIFNEPAQPHAYVATNVLLRGLDAAALRGVVDRAGPGGDDPPVVELRHLGGALARPPAVPNAVGHRDAAYVVRFLSVLGPDVDTGLTAAREAHRRVAEALGPAALSGDVLNFMYGERPSTDGVRAAYDPDAWDRLTRLKGLHDPTNMFRLNHNIPPG